MAKSFDVSYRFIAIDQFTSIGEKIRGTVDKIKDSISSMGDVTSGAMAATKSMGDGLAAMGEKVKNVGSTLSRYVSLPLGAVAANMIRLSNIQEQAEAKVALALRNYRGTVRYEFNELKRMASQLQSESLFGDEDILTNITARLLAFSNIGEEQFIAAHKAVLDMAAATGTGLNTIGLYLARALSNPSSNISMLERQGLSFFSEFDEDLRIPIKDLQAANRLLDAQKMLLQIIEQNFGGMAEQMSMVGSGPLTQAWMRLGDINETIGKSIQTTWVDKLVDKADSLFSAFERLDPTVVNVLGSFIVIGAAAGTFLVALGKLAVVIGSVLLPAVISFIPWMVKLAIAMSPVLVPVALIASAFFLAYKGTKMFLDYLQAHFPNIFDKIAEKIDWVKDKLTFLLDRMREFKNFFTGGGIPDTGDTEGPLTWGEKTKNLIDWATFLGKQKLSAFDTSLAPKATEDTIGLNVTIRSPEDLIEDMSIKTTERIEARVGWQMVNG